MDRNPPMYSCSSGFVLSLSARRAWIEIHSWWLRCWQLAVALRKESVDRNNDTSKKTQPGVALRKESVDRNLTFLLSLRSLLQSLSARRAWIEISFWYSSRIIMLVSLSARRAWIEISTSPFSMLVIGMSLSARRAWIEIQRFSGLQWRSAGRSPQGERG